MSNYNLPLLYIRVDMPTHQTTPLLKRPGVLPAYALEAAFSPSGILSITEPHVSVESGDTSSF